MPTSLRCYEFGSPAADFIERVPYPLANTRADWLFEPACSTTRSQRSSPSCLTAIAVLADAFEQAPSNECALIIERFGGEGRRVEPTATAYTHREPSATYTSPAMDKSVRRPGAGIAWARTHSRNAAPHMAERAYTDYLPADDHDGVRQRSA